MMQEENTTGLPSEMPAGKEPLRSERDPQEEGVRRKQARKRKHVEGDMGQLQKQMQGMQETLNTLFEAQQWAAEPQDLGLPLSKRPSRHPDELSVAASGVFGRDENDVPSEQEDISESEMGDSASEAYEAIALDPSDKAVVSRAAEHAKLPSQAASTSPQCLIEALSVVNQRGCQYFLILYRSCSLPGRPLVLRHSLGHSWATWQGQQLMGWLQLLRSDPHLLC